MNRLGLGILIAFLGGCGGGAPNDNPGGQLEPEPDPIAITVDAGADETLGINQLLRLHGSAQSTGDAPLQLTWSQTRGPQVIWLNGQAGGTLDVLLPGQAGELEFQLTASDGNESATDTVAVTAQGCALQAGEVFRDCLSAEFGPFIAFASSPTVAGTYFNGDADRHVQWQWVDTGDAEHGKVIEITWNANDLNHQVDANGWFGVSMRNGTDLGPVDMGAYANGSLAFDMRLIHHEVPNAPSGFDMKLECVYPCVSEYFPISGVQSDYNWKTYEFSMAELINSGLDITKVNHALVIHPRWAQQEQNVTVQLDNIRFSTAYTPPPPDNGCIASGNVTYQLARAANPSADQQEAYNLITKAMDTAVEKYNCYTNLTRALYVEYNPGVATADGNPNGTIRFGSRASMHHVTAMHEISHVFGVGANNYRTLVVDRVFTGSRATAKLRELTGDPSAVINTDGTHLWPYGLNYISEGSTETDLLNHCLIVEAMVKDLQAL